jgi:hypothetical protein
MEGAGPRMYPGVGHEFEKNFGQTIFVVIIQFHCCLSRKIQLAVIYKKKTDNCVDE